MNSYLTDTDYILDVTTNVWSRQDYTGIAYSDGDEVEQRIASIINEVSDLDVLSTELRQHCTDWPSLYHLSGTRANILRPFENDLHGDILEIGAGCGAITRYLGECGGNVLALEGSPRRAAIARARTRNLQNVTVVSDRFDLFSADRKFDAITLIGVLEYANLFTSGEKPALNMLGRVRALLKPEGKLFIAIENQLGLKYFAGAPEDHLGQPMYGIEGRYRNDQPQTFGRIILTEMLKEAGFSACDFLAPFPDYKLPVSVITERGFKTERFDAAAFAWQSVQRDPQLPSTLVFSPELVWPTLAQNNLALDLANSFLIVASSNKEPNLESSALAWHFTTERKKEFCKVTSFVQTEADGIEVRYKSHTPTLPRPVIGKLLKFAIPDRASYVYGAPLSQEFIQIVTRDGWRIEELCILLRKYLDIVANVACVKWQIGKLSEPTIKLPGSTFDYIPQNIITSTDGGAHIIDKEWEATESVQIGFLCFRSLITLFHNVTKFGHSADEFGKTYINLIQAVMNGLGWLPDKGMIISYVNLEAAIQTEVSGRVVTPKETMDWLDGPISKLNNLNQAVVERDSQIANLNQAVIERDGQIAKLNKTLTESDRQIISLNRAITKRDEQIASLGQAVTERDSQIIAIYNSRSWRITRPLRFLGTLVSKTQHILVLFRTLLYRSGSLRQTMRKILQVLLREGWQGVRMRLEYPTNIEIKKGNAGFDPQKDIVLVVSHDASRTGAPILTLSIVQRLQKKYNVISLLLGEGSITEHFSKNSSFLIEAPFARNNTLTAHSLIEQLVRQHDIQFAIVNSIESRIVLPPLARHFIPTIHLIHEFAAYTRPISAFVEALLWARETVFSTPITYKDALACHSELNNRPCHIIPQGLYDLPAVEKDNLQATTERDRIFSLLHPNDKADDSIIIIGIGSVHLRKGVDLFIECATHLAQTEFSDRLRFVWVGAGYDPINDSAYSVYLADQIRRAGIQEHMIFLGEISNPDIAYQAADIMLLSSRLDPLPGVAIEAMMHGVPLVCFENTTGIADVLIEHGLGAYCVAHYLNVVDMADKVLSFVQSKMLREETGEKLRQIAREVFNMERYIDKLVGLAMLASHRTKQEQVDLSEIKKAGLERLDYFTSPEINLLAEEALRYYVRTWASNVKPRKLFPGFHPGIYAEQHGLSQPNADPLADYIRAKRPAGVWKYEILTEEAPRRVLPTGTRVALHLHVYYPDLLPDILAELKGNHIKPDLFISVPNDNACSEVQVLLSQEYPTWKVNLQIVPNRGRDLGPLLTTFSSTFTQDYDLVGHLHTKKTVDVTDANMSRRWFCFLLKNLLGGKYAMADKILAHFASDPSIGMVFPDDPNIVGWSLNRPYAEKIGRRLCLSPLPQHFLFPIGTMFWARVEALKPLFDLNLTWDDYPVEPLPYDGSFLHALERILPFVVAHQGFRCVLTNIKGITR